MEGCEGIKSSCVVVLISKREKLQKLKTWTKILNSQNGMHKVISLGAQSALP